MRTVSVVLLLAAFAQFGVRAVRHRDEVPLWDFAGIYSASRAWVHGSDPYDRDRVRHTWEQTGILQGDNVEYWYSVYPPTSLTMLAPVAILPPWAALAGWFALTLILLMVQFAAVLDLAGLRLSWRDPRGLLLIAAALAAAPLQFGLLSGQPSTPAIAAAIIAVWCIARGREAIGGVVLGLVCAWKPHIGLPFILYYLLLRRWRSSDPALIVIAMIAAVSLAAMQLTDVNWMNGWMQNIEGTLARGGVNDRATTGPFRDQIIDLQILLASMYQPGPALQVAAACVVAALVAWFIRIQRAGARASTSSSTASSSSISPSSTSPPTIPTPRSRVSSDLLPLAALAGMSLMAVYHRVYDAAVLMLAFAWALSSLRTPRRGLALVAIAIMSVFLIPFDVLGSVTRRAPLLQKLSDAWWWETFIVPHYAWGLLAITLMLLWAMRRNSALAADQRPESQSNDSAAPVAMNLSA